MPDHSHDNVSSDHANLAVASEGQLWDNLSVEQRAQLLGQSIVGEANNSNIKNSVYQTEEGKAYETMPYTSLPPQVQFAVSNRLHEAGYFQDSYGGNVYEVEGDDRYECKDCEETFTSEEDFRVHRKVNHDDNGESETESQEAYFRSLQIDPDMTRDNLSWARKVIRGESSRVSYPQNDPPTKSDVPLPKGRKEYDDNPNHYFYDNKLFRRGSRGAYYGQDGVALTEARKLIELEDNILNKYGWESTKDIEKDIASREVFATEVAKNVNVNNLHPRTVKILDSVNKPFLVNTLTRLAQEADAEDRGDIAPFIEEEPILHQDYDPEHPHEHNAFDQNFGDKVAEEDIDERGWSDDEGDFTNTPKIGKYDDRPVVGEEETNNYEVDIDEYINTGEPVQKVPEDKRSYDVEDFEDAERTCKDCGAYFANEEELHSHVQDHVRGETPAQEDFPFEEEETTVTAEPDLLQNTNADVLQVESEDYNPEEKINQKAEEIRIIQQYTGYKPKAGEALGDILDGAIDVPLEQQTVEETIYDRKLDGYHEDKIARELNINYGLEYEEAVEKIRSIEVNDNDRTAKTLFGKKFADCNEAEISEMRILGGEAKKRSKGDKNGRRL